MLKTTIAVALLVSFGLASCQKDGRIVNGTNADPGEYPFIVSIQYTNRQHYCAGTIITQCCILTAAHCVDGEKPNEMLVRYGVTDLSEKDKSLIGVQTIIMHENYNKSNYFANDIALLKLNRSVFYVPAKVGPVRLLQLNSKVPTNDNKGTVIGWGLTKPGGKISNRLQQADVKIYPDQECKAMLRGVLFPSQMYSGVDGGGRGHCQGDSGGPLLYKNYQLGLVSWVFGNCSQIPYPAGVLTSLSYFFDWIHKHLNTTVKC